MTRSSQRPSPQTKALLRLPLPLHISRIALPPSTAKGPSQITPNGDRNALKAEPLYACEAQRKTGKTLWEGGGGAAARAVSAPALAGRATSPVGCGLQDLEGEHCDARRGAEGRGRRGWSLGQEGGGGGIGLEVGGGEGEGDDKGERLRKEVWRMWVAASSARVTNVKWGVVERGGGGGVGCVCDHVGVGLRGAGRAAGAAEQEGIERRHSAEGEIARATGHPERQGGASRSAKTRAGGMSQRGLMRCMSKRKGKQREGGGTMRGEGERGGKGNEDGDGNKGRDCNGGGMRGEGELGWHMDVKETVGQREGKRKGRGRDRRLERQGGQFAAASRRTEREIAHVREPQAGEVDVCSITLKMEASFQICGHQEDPLELEEIVGRGRHSWERWKEISISFMDVQDGDEEKKCAKKPVLTCEKDMFADHNE
ncbi:hypothetical protein GALMADRAFT_215390 [Galerina marginata CBS 339.88]|uniref:Uncharacterized protein n=1 Tax=Galerina marginata (strain CBS 339.88) TaxID=685588 RepID=A0A067SGF9_GALM3|nr:hypothetical protein GALMADRAFT_215390 [Galerina marginata CBS 339.88]